MTVKLTVHNSGLTYDAGSASRLCSRRTVSTASLVTTITLYVHANSYCRRFCNIAEESTESTLGKFVMVVWLFLLLVITSSYTASLSTILTVQQLSTGITGLESLVSSGLPIGYQAGSFAYSYMRDNLNIHPSRLVSLVSSEEYESALKRGPADGGVVAIIDETPYVELFLSRQNDYGTVGKPFMKRGWGFVSYLYSIH